MIGVSRLVIIFRVASETGIRRIGIIAVMAGCTFIGYGQVCPFNPVIVVMNGEGCRFPVGFGSMAGCTIIRYADSHVIGIGSLVVVIGMATGTGIWRACITIGMAIGAGCCNMRPG